MAFGTNNKQAPLALNLIYILSRKIYSAKNKETGEPVSMWVSAPSLRKLSPIALLGNFVNHQ
jgi:hypothetical protein